MQVLPEAHHNERRRKYLEETAAVGGLDHARRAAVRVRGLSPGLFERYRNGYREQHRYRLCCLRSWWQPARDRRTRLAALVGARRTDAARWWGDRVRPHRAAVFLEPEVRGVSLHLTPRTLFVLCPDPIGQG